MKNLIKTFFFIIVLLSTMPLSAFAQGREVTIFFKDESIKTGELLSVRDSVVAVLKKSVEDDEEIASYPEIVEVALLKDIDKIRLEEYDVSGAGKGALIGAGGLTVIGFAAMATTDNPQNGPGEYIGFTAAMALGGAFYGAIIGWVTGVIISEDAEIVRPSVKRGFRDIREYARFDEREPRYVRDIIDNLLKESK
jgi:hypothetical protein